MQIVFFIFASLVALELGVHIIYHAITGKAGLEDPAFSYLKDIYHRIYERVEIRRKHDARRIH